MLLVIDIGNTNIVFGAFEGRRLLKTFRFETNRHPRAREIVRRLQSFCRQRPQGVCIGSVVPSLDGVFEKACHAGFGRRPFFVRGGKNCGVRILYKNPGEVGADRIANAAAAWERFHSACVVVDFGTATTFDIVTKKGEYAGGVIAPGLEVSQEALVRRAARLKPVSLRFPKSVVAKNTKEAMRAGLVFGYIGLVKEILSRILKKMPKGARVISTGGLSSLFSPLLSQLRHVDKNLTLCGLRIIYEKNNI